MPKSPGMRLEQRPDGSVVVRSSRTLRAVFVALGAAVALALFAQEPRDAMRLALGSLAALLACGFAAVLERAEFEFDALARRLRWRRANLFRALAGEIGFDDIRDVVLHARRERDDEWPYRQHRYFRVALETNGGEIALSNAWLGDERAQARIAEAIRAVLARNRSV
jgi:hypothetical protein